MDETLETTANFAGNFHKMTDHFLTQAIDYMPRIGIAILIFVLFIVLGKVIQMIFFRMDNSFESDKKHVLKLAGSTIKIATMIIGAITALGTLGINVNALIAGLGLGGFALGFALKDTLSNLLSGALILIYHPFSVGDTITVTGCQGKVVEVNLRYTILQGENKIYLIPNSSLFANNIEILKK